MRLGIALEGGGARCAAQLGVMTALQEAGIAPYAFAGCGAGALAAAACTLSRPAEEVFAIFNGCVRRGKLRPDALRCAVERFSGERMLSAAGRLAMPACDLETGCVRVYASMFPVRQDPHPWSRQPSLSSALCAALALPGALPPTFLNGRALCGGGMLRSHLPALLRAMGAEQVLCVRVAGFTGAEPGDMARLIRSATLFSPPGDADSILTLENALPEVSVLDTRAMAALYTAGLNTARLALPALLGNASPLRGHIVRFPGRMVTESD